MANGIAIYGSNILTPKEIEFLSIAFDASFTRMYSPGVRRHIAGALAAGAPVEEVMETLNLCVSQGIETCNLGIPILAEEVARRD
jgi:alkylhydroperoxidase/carboxymuconolactone decarboxylase family protein YurZ